MLRPRCWSGKKRTLSPRGWPGALGVEGPGQDGPGVGRGADGPAVATDEGLQVGGRVHVGHRDDPGDVGHPAESLPGLLDRLEVGHVGHGAAGVEVREQHLLVVAGEHVGRLGHEVDPTEDHELGVPVLGGQPGEAEGVAAGVGEAHDLVALIVVAEDQEARAQGGLGLGDPPVEVFDGGRGVPLGQRALEPDHGYNPLRGAPMWPAGTAWSPIRGVVGLGAVCEPGYQAGKSQSRREKGGNDGLGAW